MSGPREIDPSRGPGGALDRAPLRFIVGSTASGKTSLALRIAPTLGAEIVSLDSMNVYRGMDIGTAKPSQAERRSVPHHLIDIADPSERFDVQRYVDAATRAVSDILERGRIPVFVGGTSLYLAALLRGMFQGPPSSPEHRARLEAEVEAGGLEALRARLAAFDPGSVERIHANDRRRIVRAVEVFEQTGRTMTELQQEWGTGRSARESRARLVGVRLPTEELDLRIAARAAAMLRSGWPEEALRLAESSGGEGLGPSASQALGYDAALALARGEATFEEARDLIALRTRQFARRQRTWYRKFEIEWLDPRDPEPEIKALAVLR